MLNEEDQEEYMRLEMRMKTMHKINHGIDPYHWVAAMFWFIGIFVSDPMSNAGISVMLVLLLVRITLVMRMMVTQQRIDEIINNA